MTSAWHPTWWTETHGNAWERVKEAVRRDWEQTKHDLHMGGHELNQSISDTVKQATNREEIPARDGLNPPHVVGDWKDAELPVGYGYGARYKYGAQHPAWNERVEAELRTEWERGKQDVQRGWNEVRSYVRHGYEYPDRPHN